MQPNILLILTDEHPTRRVSCYGTDEVRTPNLDRIAVEGVRFDRAYTCSPTCTPARAGMMTGIYPQNTGAWANNLPLGQGVRTLGHYFRAAGYRTAYIGKFRTPLWETRPWSAARRFATEPAGKMRTTPWNGLDGKAKGYDTGTEIVYDPTPA